MGKVITSLQFVTQSAPSTPLSTHGNIFASASTLFFKNSDGVEYDLASTSGSIKISYYTGSSSTQTYIYNKLDNLKYLKVICVGAGGGGGSGKSRTAPFGTGGRGGGGGAIVWTQFISSQIPSSVTITVGAGGAGGSSVTAGSNGNTGGNGNNTSFGMLVIAEGGRGGLGGIGSTQQASFGGLGGSVSNSTPSYSPFVLSGVYGGGNTSGQGTIIGLDAGSVQSNFKNALSPFMGTSGNDEGIIQGGGSGGGGGGAWGALAGAGIAGSGSGVTQYNGSIINGGTPGAAGTSNAGSNGQNDIGLDMITHLIGYTAIHGIGGGGHGGGSSSGAGGNGGNYGAGGGGGGTTSTVNIASGIGGNGSPGLCILIEYF
jgi:hypothetical protein